MKMYTVVYFFPDTCIVELVKLLSLVLHASLSFRWVLLTLLVLAAQSSDCKHPKMSNGGQPEDILAAHLYTYMRFTWKYPQSTWRPTCGPPGDICDPPGDLPGVHLETYCRPTPPGRLLNGFAQLQRNYFTFMSCKNVYNFSSYQGISYKPLNTPPIPAPLQWRKY